MDARLQQFGEVAAGLKGCLQHLHEWSILDIVFGLRHVGARHEAHDVRDELPGTLLAAPPQGEPDLFATLHSEVQLARAAYAAFDPKRHVSAAAAVAEHVPDLSAASVQRVHAASSRFQPAHFVAVDSAHRMIRVVVRGTQETADVFTDIAGDCVPYAGGFVHEGLHHAAQWLLAEEAELLAALLQDNPGCVR